eukprot:jgi/Chrzof1/11572/Cz06g00200.t1
MKYSNCAAVTAALPQLCQQCASVAAAISCRLRVLQSDLVLITDPESASKHVVPLVMRHVECLTEASAALYIPWRHNVPVQELGNLQERVRQLEQQVATQQINIAELRHQQQADAVRIRELEAERAT